MLACHKQCSLVNGNYLCQHNHCTLLSTAFLCVLIDVFYRDSSYKQSRRAASGSEKWMGEHPACDVLLLYAQFARVIRSRGAGMKSRGQVEVLKPYGHHVPHYLADVKLWGTTAECLTSLKGAGYQIVATHLSSSSVPIQDIDWTRPTAFVLVGACYARAPRITITHAL